MLSKNKAYRALDKILEKVGEYDALITIYDLEEGLTRFANSEIHQNVLKQDLKVEIEIKEGKKKARVVVNQIDNTSLEEAISRAVASLKVVPESEVDVPLVAEPEDISAVEVDEGLGEKFGIRERSLLVKEGLGILEDGYSAAGSLSLEKIALALGNSRGIKRYFRDDMVKFNVVVMHKSGSTGYAEIHSDRIEDIDISAEFSRAFEKAKMGLDPVSLEPGPYTVILEPLAVGELLSYLSYVGFSGRSVQTKMSFLTDRLGERVFGENITIVDDVNNENTINLPFDFEGVKRQPLKLIEKGVAREVAYDQKSAILDGIESTGHSIGDPSIGGFPINLVMAGGDQSMEELITGTDRGILVTRFHYMNIVDPRKAILTGLTRDGTYLIEKGKITKGIKNLRFTESMLKAFNQVVGISKERRKVPHFFGVSYVPALKIKDFHFTGKTEING